MGSKTYRLLLFIVFLSAFAIRLIYLSYTPYDTRGYDSQDHFAYVTYVFEKKALPPPSYCWECWQPPLYYVTAAGILKAFFPFFHVSIGLILQVFSLIMNMLFLLFALYTASLLFAESRYRLLFISLIAFWPSAIIHSVRIGNDSMFYLFSAISLFYLVRLYHGPKHKKDDIFALLFALFALFTKSNGIILITTTACTVCTLIVKKRGSSLSRLLVLSVSLATVLAFFIYTKTNPLFMQNTVSLNEKLRVTTSLRSFATFDTKAFVKYPFTNPWDDNMGRQSFWTYLVKTGIFGEFSFPQPLQIRAASLISIVVLILMLFTIIYRLFLLILKRISPSPPFLFYGLMSAVSMIIFKLCYPFSCSNDFRYIFPIVIPALYCSVNTIRHAQNNKQYVLYYFGYLSWIVVIVLSLFFFIFGKNT